MGNIESIKMDVSKYDELVSIFKDYDIVVSALPGRYGFSVVKSAVKAAVDIVDVSYMPEDIFSLKDDVNRAGIKVVPDAGVAPGLSNILVGHAVSEMDVIDVVNIYVGGLPIKPIPPLGYVVTWSVEDLIDEYTRKPKIVIDGRIVEIEALSGLEEVSFPSVGVLEAFYTDGLRTLLHTIKNVGTMWEKTLRYRGHVEKIKFLKDLGLFSDESFMGVTPRKVLIKLLDKRLREPTIEDLLALKIHVAGLVNGCKVFYTYYLLEKGFDENGFSAMARVTGCTTSVITQLIIDGFMNMSGIIPPEVIGMDSELYEYVLDGLVSRHIHVEETIEKNYE